MDTIEFTSEDVLITALEMNGITVEGATRLQRLIETHFPNGVPAKALIQEPIGEPGKGQAIPCAGTENLTVINNPDWPRGEGEYIVRDGDDCPGCVDCCPS